MGSTSHLITIFLPLHPPFKHPLYESLLPPWTALKPLLLWSERLPGRGCKPKSHRCAPDASKHGRTIHSTKNTTWYETGPKPVSWLRLQLWHMLIYSILQWETIWWGRFGVGPVPCTKQWSYSSCRAWHCCWNCVIVPRPTEHSPSSLTTPWTNQCKDHQLYKSQV